jgi:hypothetical protein
VSGADLRIARVVTELLSPAVVAVVLPIVVAWHATGHSVPRTALLGLVVAVFYSVLPMIFLVRGARRGRWDGHWVRDREHRLVPLLACLACGLVGLAVLMLGSAPRDVIALSWAMIGTLAFCLAITQWWKISLHATVAAGAVAMVTLLYGPWMLLLTLLVALVCWARVRLTDHDAAQVIAGALVGPVVGGAVFLLLR